MKQFCIICAIMCAFFVFQSNSVVAWGDYEHVQVHDWSTGVTESYHIHDDGYSTRVDVFRSNSYPTYQEPAPEPNPAVDALVLAIKGLFWLFGGGN